MPLDIAGKNPVYVDVCAKTLATIADWHSGLSAIVKRKRAALNAVQIVNG